MNPCFRRGILGGSSILDLRVGQHAGLTSSGRGEDGSQVFIAATVILIALTPVLFSVGKGLQHRLESTSAADPEPSTAV